VRTVLQRPRVVARGQLGSRLSRGAALRVSQCDRGEAGRKRSARTRNRSGASAAAFAARSAAEAAKLERLSKRRRMRHQLHCMPWSRHLPSPPELVIPHTGPCPFFSPAGTSRTPDSGFRVVEKACRFAVTRNRFECYVLTMQASIDRRLRRRQLHAIPRVQAPHQPSELGLRFAQNEAA
jgi:hypothetical protein